MTRSMYLVLCIVVLIAVVVSVDVLFLENRFWERLRGCSIETKCGI